MLFRGKVNFILLQFKLCKKKLNLFWAVLYNKAIEMKQLFSKAL